MWTDLSRFKVIHGDKVLNAVAIAEIRMPEGMDWEDGNLVSIMDEAWTFQFLPIVSN